MTTKHPAADLLPAEPAVIRLGKKKYELRYTMLSLAFVEERHGSDQRFLRDLTASVTGAYGSLRIDLTVVLAGLRHTPVTEQTIDALVGADIDQVRAAAALGFRPMVEAFKWDHLFDFDGDNDDPEDGDDEPGEAQAGEDPATDA